MTWRTVAAVMVVIFLIAVIQSIMAGPLVTVSESFNQTGDYDLDGNLNNSFITDLPNAWFNMGLVGMFMFLGWGVARVVRREITQRGGPPR